MALYAELHRHLGGSVVPRILWRYFQRNEPGQSEQFADYADFEDFYTRPRNTLDEYLELHTIVEKVQTAETLPYFIYRLLRGAYVFENLAYLELRYSPYLRTPEDWSQSDRIDATAQIIQVVGEASQNQPYPIVNSQILCMHSKLPFEVNKAMIDLAVQFPQYVCGVDLAGGNLEYKERLPEFVELYKYALARGINTTGHLFETTDGCFPELLPYLKRVGHGIQIPLLYPELLKDVAARGQCLEICPTTYLQTGTLESLDQLKVVFDRCFEAGVDLAICTDNAGLHNVRLPFEYENLLTHNIINFDQLRACQDAAFKHAFAWNHKARPETILNSVLHPELGIVPSPLG